MQNSLRIENASHCTTPSDRVDEQLVSVSVGCLHVNPATSRGRRLYMAQMLLLAFVPHAALIMQNCTIMAQLSTTLESSLYLHTEVSTGLYAGDSLVTLQDEMLLTASYVLSSSKNLTLWNKVNMSELHHAFTNTDKYLDELSGVLMFDDQRLALQNNLVYEPLQGMSVYQNIHSTLFRYASQYWRSTKSVLSRQLSASYEILKSMEQLTLAFATLAFKMASDTTDPSGWFLRHQVTCNEHLLSAIQYLEAEYTMEKEVGELKTILVRNEKYTALNLDQSKFDDYVLSTQQGMSTLREIKAKLWNIVRVAVKREVWLSRRTLGIGIFILTMVLVASPILILLLRHTVSTIQAFTRSIELSTSRLEAEKQKSDLLLSRMLPMPVLSRLRAQRSVPAEAFDAVTIFFSDIVGFTSISAKSTPMEVINMLNTLYRLFDEKIMKYNVYKVETIGDAYMVVSGLPQRNGNRHASEIADMSLSLMKSLDGAIVPHMPDELLRIRAGVNTGPCVAGVVGTTMPRYCLFGDTINTASRMESTGDAMKIHISPTTKKALDDIGGYETISRGQLDVAGKGCMETFWLVGKTNGQIEPGSPQGLKLNDYDQNLLELLIRS